MERRRDEGREARVERLRSAVAARLRPVCAEMPQSEFDELVEHVVAVNIKYALRRSEDLFTDQREPTGARFRVQSNE